MNCLLKLFTMLTDGNSDCDGAEELFGFCGETSITRKYEQADLDFIANYFSSGFNSCALSKPARDLFELSVNAFDSLVHAWMSESPIEEEIVRFGRKVIAAAQIAAAQVAGNQEEKRRIAERAASDRVDNDTLAVLTASEKVQYEIHRMMGLLRFFPDEDGVYIARCAPDTLVIPALGEYFTARFGETAWAVFDEKRGISLRRLPGEQAKILVHEDFFTFNGDCGDEWEDLWRHYHKTINNEDRKNPNLQRRLMPKRYWKYLPEM
jgi:probable DNA metabolism protein